jgi:glycosyltransferase involved in cell wall biosynthesis
MTAAIRRILVVSDVITATQSISFLQPLQTLLENGEVTLDLLDCPRTAGEAEAAFDAAAPDLLVLSRATHEASAGFIARARARRVPCIYHIDDDLLKVPESLGPDKFRAYNNPDRLERLRRLMRGADLIYASTAALRDELREFEPDTCIVSGDIYCAAGCWPPPEPIHSPWPVIGYMGTSGHFNDLQIVLPAIERLLDEIPVLRFELFGNIRLPDRLGRFGPRAGWLAPEPNYAGFLGKLCSLGWWIGLAPIEDNPFNRCKADTKWVEYTTAGMAVVASDVPVYHRACADGCGLLAGGGDDWHHAIASLLGNQPFRDGMIARARRRLGEAYGQAALLAQLQDIFRLAAERAAARRPEIRA